MRKECSAPPVEPVFDEGHRSAEQGLWSPSFNDSGRMTGLAEVTPKME